MPDVALLLGPIAFQDFEIPSGVNFGGRQRLALHRLPGGSRVIDALGRDDAQISFAGIFAGPNATQRARALDQLRVAGAALTLTWDVLFYTVLISNFYADYRNGWWIPYQIVCTVLEDEAWALSQPRASLSTAILTDVNTATTHAADAGLNLSSVRTAITAQNASTRGTADYTSARSCLVDALSSIESSMDAAEALLVDLNATQANTAQGGAENLLAAADASGQLSSLISADAYVRRAAANLASAST